MASARSKPPRKEILTLEARIDELCNQLQLLNAEALSHGTPLIGIKKIKKKQIEKEIADLRSKLKSLKNPSSLTAREVPTPSQQPLPMDPSHYSDRPWDETTEGSLLFAKQEQMKLKDYYDRFPNIENDNHGTVLNEVIDYTNSILNSLPSGNVTERSTACHVLNRLCESQNLKCLFFDSAHGSNFHDASAYLADTNEDDRPFVMKLNNSDGLANTKAPKTEHGAIRFVQSLNYAIEENKSDPVLDDIRIRLSKAHDVDMRDIVIKTVYVGTFNVVYTVKHLAGRIVKEVIQIKQKLEEQFDQFLSAKIHPLLFRPAFDISYFDKLGNKTFESKVTEYMIGPQGKKQRYLPPSGWTRYGLRVLGKYSDGNDWLEPFNGPKNWYRAYHGTKNAKPEDFKKFHEKFDPQGVSVDAMASIYTNGFEKARVAIHGAGVYCSPNPLFPEKGYVSPVEIDTEQGRKRFKCMLQVAINPEGVKFSTDDNIWLVEDPKNIRPYGILIKEC